MIPGDGAIETPKIFVIQNCEPSPPTDRTVASSGSPSLTRRKPSSSSSTEPGRVVGRVTIPRRASEPEFPFWQQTWFIALLLAMAVGFLCLAVFLFLGLDLDTGYAATTPTPTAEGVEVWLQLPFSDLISILIYSILGD